MVLAATPRRPSYVAGTLLGTLERHVVWQKYTYS